jgi:hypothetical protein
MSWTRTALRWAAALCSGLWPGSADPVPAFRLRRGVQLPASLIFVARRSRANRENPGRFAAWAVLHQSCWPRRGVTDEPVMKVAGEEYALGMASGASGKGGGGGAAHAAGTQPDLRCASASGSATYSEALSPAQPDPHHTSSEALLLITVLCVLFERLDGAFSLQTDHPSGRGSGRGDGRDRYRQIRSPRGDLASQPARWATWCVPSIAWPPTWTPAANWRESFFRATDRRQPGHRRAPPRIGDDHRDHSLRRGHARRREA